MKRALIIFTKNLVYGKVKTRLAATVGNDKALEIYKQLIKHTHSISHKAKANKFVFYSDSIEEEDVWKNYQKQLQKGNDLGEKMANAFMYAFKNNYREAIIIGTDCPELDEQIIADAFEQLKKYDVIIGPAADGGYYLLGIKKLYRQLFEDIEWSTKTVFSATINQCNKNQLTHFVLPVLHDVDEEKDLQYMKRIK